MFGPVLFLIYVNSNTSSLQCQWKDFADYAKLYLRYPQSSCVLILQGMMLLQIDLHRVCSVVRLWNLRFNIGKCVIMRFGVCNTGNNLTHSYSIDGKVLKFVTSHRVRHSLIILTPIIILFHFNF